MRKAAANKPGRVQSDADVGGLLHVIEAKSKSRLETLSDGIFAVAMTLLVLDVKLPSISDDKSATEFAHALMALWPKLTVFVVSFIVLARAWNLHHYVFSHLKGSDHVLYYTNAFWLLAVTLLPFSTALMGEHPNRGLAAAIYSCNFLLLAILPYFMWHYATKVHRLVSRDLDEGTVHWVKQRLITSMIVFALTLVMASFSPQGSVAVILGYQLLMLVLPVARHLRQRL